MNTTKAHIAALSLLDRALLAITDDEIKALLAGLPQDHVSAIRRISGLRPDEAGTDTDVVTDTAEDADAEIGVTSTGANIPDDTTGNGSDAQEPHDLGEVVDAIRVAARKGRLNGDLQRLGVVMSDACLAECVEQLGENADLPSEDDLQAVIPGLIEHHGVGVVRLMLASTVAGEAPASATIVALLKNDEAVKLPALEPKPLAPLLPPKEDDADRVLLKAQRKERKAQEQAAARLRRDQIARAKNRV